MNERTQRVPMWRVGGSIAVVAIFWLLGVFLLSGLRYGGMLEMALTWFELGVLAFFATRLARWITRLELEILGWLLIGTAYLAALMVFTATTNYDGLLVWFGSMPVALICWYWLHSLAGGRA